MSYTKPVQFNLIQSIAVVEQPRCRHYPKNIMLNFRGDIKALIKHEFLTETKQELNPISMVNIFIN